MKTRKKAKKAETEKKTEMDSKVKMGMKKKTEMQSKTENNHVLQQTNPPPPPPRNPAQRWQTKHGGFEDRVHPWLLPSHMHTRLSLKAAEVGDR